MPEISVVMSVYNGSGYLAKAIESILYQTFTDFEFIIVDDGSTDNSLSIIKSYSDPRIVLLMQENKGLAKALNKAIALSRSSLIARMDADDISLPDRLKTQYEFMQCNPEYIVCGSWAVVIDKNGDEIYTCKTKENDWQIKEFMNKRISYGLPTTPFFHSSVMFRRKEFNQVGGYSGHMLRSQDVVLFNKMSRTGKFYNIPNVLLKYRILPESITRIKMSPKLAGELLIKSINDEIIEKNLTNAVRNSLIKSNQRERDFNYLLYLGKKYLWNNFNPLKARRNFTNAIKINPFKITPYLLVLLSFFPKQFIKRIHLRKKTKQIDMIDS